MTVYFLDSSALVKRYVPETGSAWIRAISDLNTGNSLIIARITWVEVRSAIARRQRERSLTVTDANLITQRFRFDMNSQYQVIELDSTLAETAGQLVSQYPLRAYDAVQLASVLLIQPAFPATQSTQLIFLTADNRLSEIAVALGLLSDNPNHHP
ncbi:PIN domain-containing protein [Scytonema sp. UIC 10036]|uniref:PIN domain-containing protein n=1 Tax=Scytonema sp. UIC 10036 TaxID=2304196 RepID=UPI00137C3FDF|nr:PIN domain-containing protein [Scytonema sp. UIC 10036]